MFIKTFFQVLFFFKRKKKRVLDLFFPNVSAVGYSTKAGGGPVIDNFFYDK
ncbi:hypothetical protein MDPP_00367 [Candidatus Phytoplasma pini]|uniref:Uncharacterized protein n=1 Tax=Candidatus Phytoplasma pini TaxID=267362 RepID=A0A559KIX5_9MOLU|nr:hypothetical protein MDPP_00367 [Candidatus Phytoplasma pini]